METFGAKLVSRTPIHSLQESYNCHYTNPAYGSSWRTRTFNLHVRSVTVYPIDYKELYGGYTRESNSNHKGASLVFYHWNSDPCGTPAWNRTMYKSLEHSLLILRQEHLVALQWIEHWCLVWKTSIIPLYENALWKQGRELHSCRKAYETF